MRTQLIIVEGVPGSGKTSAASFISDDLQGHGIPADLYREGDLNHPADFESVACLTKSQFEELLETLPEFESILRSEVTADDENLFLSYGKLKTAFELPVEVINQIATFDVYELPPDKFCEVLLRRWKAFATRQVKKDSTVIFECCFLQNPMSHLLIKYAEERDYILRHIERVAAVVDKLHPIVIYLNPLDVRETIVKAASERSEEWLRFVIGYHTEQGFGRKHGLHGFDGYVQALEARRSMELDFLTELPIQVVRLENPQADWVASYQLMKDSLPT